MTDKELRDAAVAHLKQTTTGYLKSNGQPKPPPWPAGSTHWGPAMDLLAQIGQEAPPPPPPPPVSSFDIPRWTQYLEAGPGVGTNGRIGWWRQYKTANNTLLDADTSTVPHLCTPAPNPRYVSGPRSWEWWCLGSTMIPTSWPNGTGKRFATINPHTSSYDVGNTGHGGIGWYFGGGVSPWHIFFSDGQAPPDAENDFTLYLDPSPSTSWSIVDDVVRARRYDFTIRVIWGRMDKELGLAGPGNPGGGIGDHPNGGMGRVWVYVDGVLQQDTGNRDTLKRAVNPDDGKTYTQTCVHRCWDGAYVVTGLSQQITMERTATRVGRTLAEALEDGKNGFTLHSEWGEGGGHMTDLSPLKSTDFKAPA